jgi:dTDP-4-amino-4,6-dideoxygalactose transaminase
MKIDFARPDREHEAQREALEGAALRVLRSGRSILGDEVSAFETSFAAFVGAAHARGVSNGTDALVVALHALGIGAGDEVIVGAYGFVAAPEAVVRVAATPVFADLEPNSLGLSLAAVERTRSERTRAIISVDLFGIAHDTAALREACPSALIVEDAAQALGATVGGRHAGTLGDIGTFSFFPSKALGAAGDGGACVTADPTLAERIASIRMHGKGHTFPWETRGGNYRLDALQAALLGVKLKHLPARLVRRRAIGAVLVAAAIEGGATPIVGSPASTPAFAPLALRVRAADRVHWIESLRAQGIDARVHYPTTLPACPPFAAFASAQQGAYVEAARAAQELFSVPCHPELSDNEVEDLEAALRRGVPR